jgi:mono/diheme cytochrome c family protein
MRRLIIAIALVLAVAVGGYTQTTRLANSSSPSYSKDQADRGKVVYGRYCSKCHLENLKGNCPQLDLSSTSYVCSAPGNAPPLTGAPFMHRFYSVGDLYSRVKWTMPADKVASLPVEDNLSVVAYLLQANGILPGQEDLKAAAAMKTMALSKDVSTPRATKVTEQRNSLGISQAYYTEAQAERGKAYFYSACGVCHTADPKSQYGTMETSTGLGWHRGSANSYGLFVGDAWLASASGIPGRPQRWDTVADLYNKVRTTQPAYDVAGLSTQEYLDVIAYLLKQNGLPAGNEELKNDINQMRNMTLDKGFERLFNGKDFTGWGFVVGPNCKPLPEGCGSTTPGTTFKVEEGAILNTGSPHGYMYPLKKFWNFTLRLQYRFDPYPGMESDDDLFTNTGYLLFITQHDVWPRTLEVQGKNDFEMSLAMGANESTFTFDDAARIRARKPVGQWNSIEIVSKDGQLWTYLNGTLITHVTKHPFTEAGYIGFQVESGPVHWRNIRIKAD